ncbi:hypothetical protein EXIGLDRAFT_836581 [Exidia glandulosa HHB12029]|uniref:MYND-type domain-containing protein n=1 Tax=Exidia glandulosa HHB12029 TaxID=1314781 RepID=A0A165HPZ8_EXIGL|nr:hypothetical protein EXIGLDRAFT_836581 [Exidia glandulosa HHB12029]
MSNAPKHSTTKKAQLGVYAQQLKQCQTCYKTTDDLPAGTKLLGCGACGRAHYCSRECQKVNWKDHKPFCTANQGVLGAIQTHENRSLATCEDALKKWIQLQRPLLFLTLARALELYKTPNRIMDELLVIVLSRTSERAIEKAFVVEEASVVPMEMVAEKLGPALTSILERSKNSLSSGGGGCGLVMSLVKDYDISHVTPVQFEHPVTTEEVKPEPQWEEQLKAAVGVGLKL